MTGPILRLAWRDARRGGWRTLLTVALIALPVLAVTAAAVLIWTADVDTAESLDRRLGTAADAQVTWSWWGDDSQLQQGIDPDDGFTNDFEKQIAPGVKVDASTIVAALGRSVPIAEISSGGLQVPVAAGVADLQVVQLDLDDPLTRGLVEVVDGRAPEGVGEVLVSPALADRGLDIGDRLDADDPSSPVIVGVGRDSIQRTDLVAWGLPGSIPTETPERQWLIGGGDVTWSDVRALNAIGGLVLSRAVVEDPSAQALAATRDLQSGGDDTSTVLAVAALVASMAPLEVVLLAGPAFAVAARRQARILALVVAAGGTPAQARRVILSGALVIGGLATGAGLLLGILAARLLVPAAQRLSSSWLGPFEVPLLPLLGVAAFGLAAALLAAVVPARIAGRQDVVAVLTGRRGDPPAGRRSPVVGVVAVAVGATGALVGTRLEETAGVLLISASTVVAVLGSLLVVPVLLGLVARLSGRLPLAVRFAARDATRHRSRTVPAVAAVAATVCGVVAVGIGIASDQEQDRATYLQTMPLGVGQVSAYDATETQWDEMAAVTRETLSGATVHRQRGVADDGTGPATWLRARVDGAPVTLDMPVGSPAWVADEVPAGLFLLSDDQLAAVNAALAEGRVVIATDRPRPDGDASITATTRGRGDGRSRVVAELPASFLPYSGSEWVEASMILPTSAADDLRLATVHTLGLRVGATEITSAQDADLSEALRAVSPESGFGVERGWQPSDEVRILYLVLAGLAAVLMIGGTLVTTLLALSDARPDLATLAAIGARPRTRRGIAAGYALVVALVGSLLGAALGFVPGVAVTWPLTSQTWTVEGAAGAGHHLEIPWLLIGGVVLLLPLVTAGLMALLVRSRLPLVARVE